MTGSSVFRYKSAFYVPTLVLFLINVERSLWTQHSFEIYAYKSKSVTNKARTVVICQKPMA